MPKTKQTKTSRAPRAPKVTPVTLMLQITTTLAAVVDSQTKLAALVDQVVGRLELLSITYRDAPKAAAPKAEPAPKLESLDVRDGGKALAEVPLKCPDCGAALNSVNTSKSAKDGRAIHVGCPGEVVNIKAARDAKAAAPITIEQLRQAAVTFGQKKGRPALEAALKNLGIAKLSEALPENYARVLEIFNA
jgi:hypothetical protein